MTKLPIEYKEALQGLQEQARYATELFTNSNVNKSKLTSAQALMSKNKYHVKLIIKAAETNNMTIPTIDEDWLLNWLIESEDLSVSHLTARPFYYAACNAVDGVEYYFITTYFNDVRSCCGHSEDLGEVIRMANESVQPYSLQPLNLMPKALSDSLTMPMRIINLSMLNDKVNNKL